MPNQHSSAPVGRYDEMEIEHVWMTHDWSVSLTPREKAEIVRRWERSGRVLNDLEAISGWNVARYAKLIPEGQRPMKEIFVTAPRDRSRSRRPNEKNHHHRRKS